MFAYSTYILYICTMAQLHCYVPDEVAARLREKARMSHTSVSKYLAYLVRKEIDTPWPDDFFTLFGAWQGQPLVRPEQGEFEARNRLD